MLAPKQLVQFSKAARESTLKRLKAIPRGFENWRISEDSLSPAEICQHLIDADSALLDGIKNGKRDDCIPESGSIDIKNRNEFEKLIYDLDQSLKKKNEIILNLNDDNLSRIVEANLEQGKEKIPVWWLILRLNLDHEIHHRGQLALYLKLIDKEKSGLTEPNSP